MARVAGCAVTASLVVGAGAGVAFADDMVSATGSVSAEAAFASAVTARHALASVGAPSVPVSIEQRAAIAVATAADTLSRFFGDEAFDPSRVVLQRSPAQLEIDAEALRRAVDNAPPASDRPSVVVIVDPDTLEDARRAAEHLVDGVRPFVVLGRVVNEIAVADVADLAARLVTDTQRIIDGTIDSLPAPDEALDRLAEASVWVGERQADGVPGAGEAVGDTDTLLAWAAGQAYSVVRAIAPTAEQAFAAAGDLATWLDELSTGPMDSLSDLDAGAPVDRDTLHEGLGDVPVAEQAGMSFGSVPEIPSLVEENAAVANTLALVEPWQRCGWEKEDGFCHPPMMTLGGPVFRNPVVQVVFWGPNWARSDHADYRAAVERVFASMSGSSFQRVLTQYYDSKGFISPSVTYNGSWIDTGSRPVGHVTDTQSINEAIRAYQANRSRGWKRGPNVVWVVVSQATEVPSGLDGSCGFQAEGSDGAKNPYAVAHVDFPSAAGGCMRAGDTRRMLTMVAAHEYAGAVATPYIKTDPAWVMKATSPTGNVVYRHLPDICRSRFFPGPGGELVSEMWSNGTDGCARDFTPTWRYDLLDLVQPSGDPNGLFTRGHAYKGVFMQVRNTGSMPWLPGGANPTFLGAVTPSCSPFYDRAAGSGWASCRRVRLRPSDTVAVDPGETGIFEFTLRPGGELPDRLPASQSFNLVTENRAWMTRTDGSANPTVTLKVAEFKAAHVSNETRDYIAVGVAGAETTVDVTVGNSGSATWFANEVAYLAVDSEDTQKFAAATWPRGPGGCRNCRAHRVATVVAPQGTLTARLTLRIPAATTPGVHEAWFVPVADVARVTAGGVATTKLHEGRFRVQVIVLPELVGHAVTGYGVVTGSSLSENAIGATSTAQATGRLTCAAVAGVTAATTVIETCSVTVTHADGSVATAAAPRAAADGPVAVTSGSNFAYDPRAGDTARACWTVASNFPDGTVVRTTGCTQ